MNNFLNGNYTLRFFRFQRMAEDAPRLVREKGQKIILGVDRLDYTKGLAHRLKAFERFLEKHPEHIEEVDIRNSLEFNDEIIVD